MPRRRNLFTLLPIVTVLATNFSSASCLASEQRIVQPSDEQTIYLDMIADAKKSYGADAKETLKAKVDFAVWLKNQARNLEAERIIRPVLASLKQSCGPDSIEVERAEDQLGRILRHQHRLAEAELHQRRAVAICEKILPADAPVLTDALVDLAKVLSETDGRLKDAKALYLRALEIGKKTGNKKVITNVCENLATCLLVQNEAEEARKYFLEALPEVAANKDVRPDSYANLLTNIAQSYYHEKRYDDAYQYLEQALAALAKGLSPSHRNNAVVLNIMADINTIKGNYTLASNQLQKSNSIETNHKSDTFVRLAESQRFKFPDLYANLQPGAKSTLAPDIAKELAALKSLSSNSNQNRTTELEKIYRNRCAQVGKDNPLSCEAALEIAVMLQYFYGRKTPVLVALAEPGITSFASKLLQNDTNTDFQQTVKLLGGRKNALDFVIEELLWLAYLNGQQVESKPTAAKNLELMEKCLAARAESKESKNTNSLANAPVDQSSEKLLTMASAWLALGNYQQSARLTERVLAIAATQKNVKLEYAALVQLATLDLAESDTEPAKTHANAAKSIALTAFGANAAELIPCYRILAQVSLSSGNYAEAKRYASDALNCKNVSTTDTIFLHNISGFSDLSAGQYQDAKTELEKSLALCNDELSDQAEDRNLFTAASTALAEALINLGERTEALRELDWALSSDQHNYAPGGLMASARDCAGLTRIEELEGDHATAARYALTAAEYTDKFLRNGFKQLSFAQQCSYINVTRQMRSLLLDSCNDPDSLPKAYAYMINWKGLLLETLRSQSETSAAIASASPPTRSTIMALSNIRVQLGALANGDISTMPEFTELTQKKESLERQLSMLPHTRLSADAIADHDVEWFRKLLKPDQAFLDLVTYNSTKDNSEHYALIAMKAGEQGQPHFFDIGLKKKIDSQIAEWRSNITQQFPTKSRDADSTSRDLHRDSGLHQSSLSPEEYLQLTQSLTSLFINNPELSKFLGKGINKIWLCPEAEMARMPWNSLSTIGGRAKATICEIDSPREFVQIALSNPTPTSKSDKLLLAGVSSFHDTSFSDLPGTEKEINGIKTEADQAALNTEVLLDGQATKANVFNKIGAATVAHFSTHGFARGDSAVTTESDDKHKVQFGLLSIMASIARNPLTDSGLVLSPATENSETKEKSEAKLATNLTSLKRDGGSATKSKLTNLLTAEEIVGLNLKTCKLVSLSACKTGLGTGLNGQGVIGLRSAILAAGARSILMSLWSVDDDATEQLMRKFYSYLLDPKNPLTEVESLQKAQDYIRSQPQWQSPNYWAGWVIAGDGWQSIR